MEIGNGIFFCGCVFDSPKYTQQFQSFGGSFQALFIFFFWGDIALRRNRQKITAFVRRRRDGGELHYIDRKESQVAALAAGAIFFRPSARSLKKFTWRWGTTLH